MKIITKTANPSGAYPSIQEGASQVYDGFALWPESLDTAVFYEHNGFVSLTFEEINGVSVVAGVEPNKKAWEAWASALPVAVAEAITLTVDERVAALEERTADLLALLHAFPSSLTTVLLKDENCAAILSKYGITGQ